MNEIPEELQERIAAYIDGQLPPAEAARLEVFLANTDRQLADQVIGMIADRNRMNLMPKPRAPRDLAARIMDQVERTTLLHDVEHLSGGHRRWWQSRAAIAAGVAIMLGGFTYVIIQQVWRTADHPWQQLVDGRPVGPAAVGGRAVEDRDEHAKGIAEVGAMKSMAKGDEGLMSNRDKVADTQNIGRADGVIASAGAAGQSMAKDAGATREGVTAMAEGVNGPVQTVPPTQSAAMQVAVAPPATTFAAPAMAAASTKPAETQLASAGGMADPVPTLRGAGGGGGGGRGGAAGRGGRGGGGGGGGAGGAGAGGLGGGAGGAGGGGFGGGGGGRRGGAGGPGGGTGAMAVAPNSAMASELKQIDAADRALKALATLTGSGSDPLVVSLVARDNLDYTKLRSFIAQANGNDYNGKMMANGGQQAPNNFDNNRAQTGGANTSGGQFGMNNGITGGITGNSTTQFNDLSVRNSNNDRQLGNGMNNLREESAAFRVMLRPDQLETLAKDYRVVVLARGKEVHLLGTIGDKTPPTADASTRDELLRRAGFVTQVANSQPQAEQTRVAQNVAATPPTPPPAAQQVQSKEQQQPLMVTQDRANSTLIDCLITMESAPLTATAPASGAPAATSPVNR